MVEVSYPLATKYSRKRMSSSEIVSYNKVSAQKNDGHKIITDLSNIRDKGPAQKSAENAERAGDQEWILTSASRIGGIVLGNWKDVGAHKSANLGWYHCQQLLSHYKELINTFPTAAAIP